MSKDDLHIAAHDALGRLERAEEILALIRQQIGLANDANRQMARQLADEYRRAEKAEKERDEWRQACLAHGERADRAERQSDEAIAASDARVEAMREAAASKANDMGDWGIYEAILALPIPAQEVK